MSTKNWLQSEHPWAHCCGTHYPGSRDGPVPAQHWISDSHPSWSNTVRIPLPQVNVSRKAHDWNGSLLWWHCRWFPARSYLGMGPCLRAWCRGRLPWTRCQSSGYSSTGIPLVRCSMVSHSLFSCTASLRSLLKVQSQSSWRSLSLLTWRAWSFLAWYPYARYSLSGHRREPRIAASWSWRLQLRSNVSYPKCSGRVHHHHSILKLGSILRSIPISRATW